MFTFFANGLGVRLFKEYLGRYLSKASAFSEGDDMIIKNQKKLIIFKTNNFKA